MVCEIKHGVDPCLLQLGRGKRSWRFFATFLRPYEIGVSSKKKKRFSAKFLSEKYNYFSKRKSFWGVIGT